ncbi:hypothetical protein Tco_0488812 [Tanacetum coccineum]
METQKPLLKDEDGEEVDVHMYRYLNGKPKLDLWYPKDSPFDLVAYTDSDYVGPSLDIKSTTGGCQLLGCRLISWQRKKQTVVANSTTVAEDLYDNNSTICIIKNPIFHKKNKALEIRHHFIRDGKKIIVTEASVRRDLQLEDEEGIGRKVAKFELTPHQYHPTITQSIYSTSKRTQKPYEPKRKDTQVPQLSDPSENVTDKVVHKELGGSLVRATTTASSLEAEQDSGNITKTGSKATPNESSSVGTTSGGGPRCQETMGDTIAQTRVESSGDEEDLGEDASKQGRRINVIDANEDITLVNVQDDADNEMFDVNALNGEEVFVAGQNENVNVEEVVDALKVRYLAATTVTITTEEITLAQALEALKTSKPKVKGIVFQEIDADYQLAERLQAQEQEEALKPVNTFEDFRTELVEGKEKRARTKLVQEITNKQKVEDDKEIAEIKKLMEIFPDEEEVTVDAIPLAVKYPSIVDWKIHKEGRKSYYQIIRADGKS